MATKRTVTLSALNLDITYSVKDDSVRGCHTENGFNLKVGDKIVIDNYFTEIVEEPAEAPADEIKTETAAPKMATFEEINAQIRAELNQATKHAAADAYDITADAYRDTLRAFHQGNATEDEKNTAKERERVAIEALKREQESNANHKMRAEILKENAMQAFFAQYIAKICEIWNAYAGKPHGEKTADKIRAELNALTGQNIYIGNKYAHASISIYTARGVSVDNFEIGAKSGSEARALDENNRILKIDPDALTVYYCGEYVYNIGAHIKALKKAHEDAKKAMEKAREAFNKYNELTRGNMNRASTRDGHAPHTITR